MWVMILSQVVITLSQNFEKKRMKFKIQKKQKKNSLFPNPSTHPIFFFFLQSSSLFLFYFIPCPVFLSLSFFFLSREKTKK